jgi:hypothetical protein
VDARGRLEQLHAVERLAACDASLFVDPKLAAHRLGWVGLPALAAARAEEFAALAASAIAAGITDVVLLGMGGSSLAAIVISRSIPPESGHPTLHVLDTTSPTQTRGLLDSLDPAQTLVVVSSKSGGSVEPLALAAVFEEWLEAAADEDWNDHFIAITDPGSPLADLASDRGFATTVLAPPDIGGRYSALSPFAMLPAALTGIDIARLAATAGDMEAGCMRPADDNPALALASWLADGLESGRDKLHIVCSASVCSFGLWAEQLVAESTGKAGRGILPVLEGAKGTPDTHGTDAMTFVLRAEDDDVLAALPAKLPVGEPVFEVVIDDPHALAAEFIHWEWAVALLCAVTGIECFGQPDVEGSKARTMAILAGEDTASERYLLSNGIALSATEGIPTDDLARALAGLVGHLPDRGYLAVLAYLPEDESVLRPLRNACTRLAATLHLPVTLELGPRYLHSTGQYHKGGPAEGAFLSVTLDGCEDLPIPDARFTLGQLFAAQAAGDVAALTDAGLPVLSVGLPTVDHIDELARALACTIRP